MSKPIEHFEELKNSGFLRIGGEFNQLHQQADQKSAGSTNVNGAVLVIGPGRSGTSIISGMMHAMGVYCGDQASSPVFEDLRLRGAITNGSWSAVEKIAAEYTTTHPTWCFKWTIPSQSTASKYSLRALARKLLNLPHATNSAQLIDLYQHLGRPPVILMFKDVFSIANRNRISISGDLLTEMDNALIAYRSLHEFLHKCQPDALLVSAEKAVLNKEMLLDRVIDFCNLKPTPQQKDAVLKFVTPDPEAYLLNTRSDQCTGSLASIKTGSIGGWAKFKNSKETATVALFINDQQVATVKANSYRSDLEGKVHPQGTCAFSFGSIGLNDIPEGASVRVRVVGDTQDLSNSPQRYRLNNSTH